ncbi:hypothetical protein BC833DRAFT_121674 [Globomyces pollinis-pini]|nr:hypothetical protein BC833DRAFT_121674 [Globomyces pollinis-pini]
MLFRINAFQSIKSLYSGFQSTKFIHFNVGVRSLNLFPLHRPTFSQSLKNTGFHSTRNFSLVKSDSKRSFKDLMKFYGPIAFLTYSIVSLVSCTLWFCLLQCGVDLSPIQRYVDKLKRSIFREESQKVAVKECKQSSNTPQTDLVTVVCLTWTIHTLIFPLRAGLTGLMTPLVARQVNRRGWNVHLDRMVRWMGFGLLRTGKTGHNA